MDSVIAIDTIYCGLVTADAEKTYFARHFDHIGLLRRLGEGAGRDAGVLVGGGP
jgi:hypothetical protein